MRANRRTYDKAIKQDAVRLVVEVCLLALLIIRDELATYSLCLKLWPHWGVKLVLPREMTLIPNIIVNN